VVRKSELLRGQQRLSPFSIDLPAFF